MGVCTNIALLQANFVLHILSMQSLVLATIVCVCQGRERAKERERERAKERERERGKERDI